MANVIGIWEFIIKIVTEALRDLKIHFIDKEISFLLIIFFLNTQIPSTAMALLIRTWNVLALLDTR